MQKISIECKSAAMNRDFTLAHELLNQLESDYISYEGGYKDKKEKKRKRYEDTFDYVFNEEAMYLCSEGDKESIDRITFLLSSIPISGVAIPEGTVYRSNASDLSEETVKNNEEYTIYAIKFNQKCDILIDLAISNNNFMLIQKILPLYKSVPDPIKHDYLIINEEYHTEKVTYSNDAVMDARIKVNNAIKDGVFPNINKEIK
jgi:hypothetical protein